MATQRSTIVQNENLLTHKGKGANDIKAKAAKPAKQGRQALRDLSKDGKPVLSGATKAPTLKQKSGLHAPERKTESKSYHLTDEELKKCQEWAKEGIEQAHFTGTDAQKRQQEIDEERIKKKVEKVLTSLREWMDISYGFPVSAGEYVNDSDDDLPEMELMPEELPCKKVDTKFNFGITCKKGHRYAFEDSLSDWDFPSPDPLEFKLKDDYDE